MALENTRKLFLMERLTSIVPSTPKAIIYRIAVSLVKLSILLFYRRIFHFRRLLMIPWIVTGIVMAWCIAMTLVSIFQCQPILRAWDKSVLETCTNANAYLVAQTTAQHAYGYCHTCSANTHIMEVADSKISENCLDRDFLSR